MRTRRFAFLVLLTALPALAQHGATNGPAILVRDTIVVGAALQAGTAPASKENVPGYIRGFDVRTGKKLWTGQE